VKGGLLLDVIVGQGTTVFKLLASEDQALLVGWDAFLVLDFGLDVLNGVGGFDFESDRLTRKGFHEDLHTTAESQYQMECGLLLDVIVRECTAVFELLASEDQALLVGWDTFLVLNLCFYVFDCVGAFNFQSNGLTSKGLYEDLHFVCLCCNRKRKIEVAGV